jgi:hypothetical protein
LGPSKKTLAEVNDVKLLPRLAVAVLVGVWVSGLASVVRTAAQGQATASTQGKKSGEFFKNVSTSTLKELSVDDFLGTMGVISAALGFDCADCHPGAGTDNVDFVIDSNPRKKTARRMVEMVATINRSNFGGVQRVTCWTCHHGRETPATSIALDTLYDNPNSEVDDIVRPAEGQPSADEILDKYIRALGGAQRLRAVTSFVAKGNSVGYSELGGSGEFTIYAKAPNQRTTLITFKETDRPESVWAFDGRTGWVNTPRGLFGEYELAGEELDGERLEAQLAFPWQIKQALTNWRVGLRRNVGDHDFLIVQGSGPRGLLATMYFDPQSGLLSRLVRYGPSPVGHVLTQVDYGDYREVGGVKFPFEYKFSWLDGRYAAKMKEVKTNVAIDPAIFGKPSARR